MQTKIKLSKETMRRLSGVELEGVKGGGELTGRANTCTLHPHPGAGASKKITHCC